MKTGRKSKLDCKGSITMRLKKGFTLAEILIVLMVIGVIATLTIPSMMKGVTEAQLKAGYKKAYNTISNFAAMERVSGALPARATEDNIAQLYQSLNSSLSVKSFAQQGVNAGSVLQNNGTYSSCITASINGTDTTIGTEVAGENCITLTGNITDGSAGGATAGNSDVWIITEDNLAYTLMLGGATDANCATKQAIGAQANDADASDNSCVVLVVDVNGLSKGPNTFEVQGLSEELAATDSLETLTGDQYKIYFGIDGATAGPRATTVTGRIAADIK